jgi:hypothetical protein
MRGFSFYLVILVSIIAAGCGGQQLTDAEPSSSDLSTAESPHGESSKARSETTQVPTDILISDEIRNAWSGVRVQLVSRDTGSIETFELSFGEPVDLGDSGLRLTVSDFIPDFIMDEEGITSQSPDPNNPAAKILVQEEGVDDYSGWLFAAMPEIHPFPHEKYELTLVEGLQ